MVYETRRKIRFADVDPAGIVFYPRYFEMINEVVEDWFAGPLQTSFAELTLRRRYGMPLAHIDVDFVSPSSLDEEICFSLGVERVGRSSVRLRIEARHNNELRLSARLALVHVDLATHKSAALPPDLRAAMESHLTSPNGFDAGSGA